MNQNVIHIGLDVDDTLCHGTVLNTHTGEVMNFTPKSAPRHHVTAAGHGKRLPSHRHVLYTSYP
jgi:hypothetical protein